MRANGRRLGRLPRTVWVALVLVVLVIGLALQNSTLAWPDLSSYSVIGPRAIAVKVYVAPCSWTRVTNVAESPTEVRVTVQTLPCPIAGPGTAALDARELAVSLATELGVRVVEDANGHPVPTP